VDLFPGKEQLQFKSRKCIKKRGRERERERTTAFIFFQKCIRNNKYNRTYLACKPGYNYQHYFQKLKSIQVSVKLFLKKLQAARYKGLTHFHSYAGL